MRHTGLVMAATMVVSAIGANATVIDISGGNTTMNQLVGNSFIVGDKHFHIDGFTGTNIASSSVTVRAVNFGLAGIGFDLVGSWHDAPGDANSSGFNLAYHVDITPGFPGYMITDSHLQFNGFAAAAGSFATVNESMFASDGGALLGNKVVFANGGIPADQWVLGADFFFTPRLSIYVVKDFQLFANGESGIATTSLIRQTFSQIPTPGAASLFAIAGLAAVRRRR